MRLIKLFLFILILVSFSFAQWFPQQSGVTESLNDLFAIDSQHLFSCGTNSTVLKTTDGTTWSQSILRGSYSLNSIYFNDSFGYVVGDSGTVFHTQNSGEDWSIISVPTGQNLNSVFILPSSRVWIGGDSSALFYSDDGVNWQSSLLPLKINLHTLWFTNGSNGWVVADSGRIFYTDDGGTIWQLTNSPAEEDLLDIAFNNNGNAFICGTNGTILKKDGTGWKTVLSLPGHTFRALSFADSATVWCAGDSEGVAVLYKSINLGTSWARQNSALFSPIHGLAFSDRYTGYACGKSGKILKTTTGGVSSISAPVLQIPPNHARGIDHRTCLTWKTSGDAEHYSVQLATDPSFSNIISAATDYNQTEWEPGTLGFNTHYYWRVRSVNILGHSPWSEIHDFITHATAPILISPQDGALDVFCDSMFSWQNQPEASKYWLQVSDEDNFSTWLWSDSSLTDSFTTVPLSQYDQTLYWRVSAKIDGGWSAWSDTLSFVTANGLNGWNALNTSTKRNLYDLEFVTIHKGWAVGSYGSVFFSDNGGVTWKTQNTPVNNFLFGTDFINDSTGWICGSGGTVLHTQNGGQSWEKLSAPSSYVLYTIQFLNPDTGWVVGERGVISKTEDGGRHWRQMSFISNQDYYAAHFLNPDTGWIAGTSWNGSQYIAVILSTKNGGNDWVSLNVQSEGILKGLFFLDPMHGWASGNDGVILRTSDGGMHWEKQDAHTFNDLNDICFADIQHGWSVGSRGVCLYTEDGGNNWTSQPSGTDKNLYAFSLSQQGTAWASGSLGTLIKSGFYGYDLVPNPLAPVNGDVATTRSNPFIWNQLHPATPVQIQIAQNSDFVNPDIDETVTSDSVFNPVQLQAGTLYYWRLRALYNGKASGWSSVFRFETEGTWVRQPAPVNENLHSVFFNDKNNGFAVGDNGCLLTTKNGGTAWQRLILNVSENFQKIYLSDAAKGWIAGANGILLRTVDGGATWQTIPAGSNQILRSICFNNTQTGWIGGGDGAEALLLKTENGGDSWQPQTLNELNQINQIYFKNSLDGWIIGSGTSFNAVRTIDGGRTWQPFTVGHNDLLYSLHFTDADHGYLTAANGFLFETVDGGNSWTLVPLSSNDDLKNLAMPNPQTLLLLGEGIHASVNHGQSWNTSLSASAFSLNDFFFADSETGWLVGENGLILKTTSAGLPVGMGRNTPINMAQGFELFQNYPNPFNPTTTISYRLSAAGHTEVSIFNILGQKVTTLINQKQAAGTYRVTFNAVSLASGIYFCLLKMDSRPIQTRKMVLLR